MTMEREEAIKTLQHCGAENYCPHYIKTTNCYGCNMRDALDMAIEALNNSIQMSNIQELQAENGLLKEMIKFYRERQTHPLNGEWIKHEIEDTCRWVECSECHKEYPNIEMNFCPNCGKDMRGNKKKEEKQ